MFSFMFLFVAAMLLDWKMSLVCVVVLPITVYPATRFAQKIKRATTTSQSRMADLSGHLHETIIGRRVVRAFNTEQFEIDRFGAVLEGKLRADKRSMKYVSLTQPVIEIIGALAMASLAGFAGWRVHEGNLDPGDFVAILAALYWITPEMSLAALSRLPEELMPAAEAAARRSPGWPSWRSWRTRPRSRWKTSMLTGSSTSWCTATAPTDSRSIAPTARAAARGRTRTPRRSRMCDTAPSAT